MSDLRISVVIATVNPRRDAMSWALDALAGQTLARGQFEVVVADNGSAPPLDARELNGSRGLQLRVVREPRGGVIFARCAGILATEADLIVFVDDDNALDPEYLEEALRIADASPEIAAFGGSARLRSDRPIPAWMNPLLPYFGIRDFGSEAITSDDHNWGPW